MDTQEFTSQLEQIKPQVWQKIQEYLPDKDPHKHYQIVREYPARQGKYFRPGLVLLACEMYGGKTEKALLTASAMQTSEDWLLIHDDIMDQSLERRSTHTEHRPSLHQIYGPEMALNAGDVLHVLMWKMLGDNITLLGQQTGLKIFHKMAEILQTTLEGQFLEQEWTNSNQIDIPEEAYMQMIQRKTCCYTTVGPIQLGALCAGMDADEIHARIEEWAIPFGKAFQIWDDVMNLKQSGMEQGKEQAGDILEGKRTLILSHVLEKCSPMEKDYITSIYSKNRKEKTPIEKNYILQLMQKYKSIEHAEGIAKDYYRQALELFDQHASALPYTQAQKIIRQAIYFSANRIR